MTLRALRAAVLAVMIVVAMGAFAGERTVTLAVDGMTCASCPYIVRTALLEIPGVERAEVSLADKKAVVTFDDAKTSTSILVEATTGVGFPSRVVGE